MTRSGARRGRVRAAQLPPLLASLAVAGFLTAEGRLRQGAEARSLEAGAVDEGTTRAIGAAFALALVGPPVAAVLPGRRLPVAVGCAGALIAAGGVGLRIAAARALGASYTRTLRVRDHQPVVDTGPYARVRHPGYAGVLAMWVGYALSWQRWAAVAPILPLIPAYARRIAAEERLLAAELGAPYERYRARTRRLVPGLY